MKLIKQKMFTMFALTLLFMIGIWHVDVAVTVLQGSGNMRVMLTNGFGWYDAVQVFHIGLYLVIGSFVGIGIIAVNEVVKK